METRRRKRRAAAAVGVFGTSWGWLSAVLPGT